MIRKQLLSFGLAVSVTCLAIMGVFVFGPELETKFFPVYSRFEIVSIEAVDETHTKVQFKYTKYRECPPQGFAWYTGELGAASRQLSPISDRVQPLSRQRPLGLQLSDTYIIDANVEQIRDATYAQIYNDCHPGWVTKSDIFP